MGETTLLRIEGVDLPVALTDCDALLGVLERILKGWEVETRPGGGNSTACALNVVREGDAWRCASAASGTGATYDDEVSAACWLAANIVKRQTIDDPRRLCLHAASVEIGGGLVVMPSRFRAGKSVLTATLAAMGRRVFGDDVLPVDSETGEGVAAGIALRLRLPPPDTLSARTRDFIAGREGPKGKRYLYLDLPSDLLAPRGTRLPILGVALLDRVDDGPAEVTRAPAGDALKQVIWQNFAREGAATAVLDRLADVVERAPCVRLRYARAEDGASALLDAFEAPSMDHIPIEPVRTDPERHAFARAKAAANLALDDILVRSEDCALRVRAGRHFLIGAERRAIMALDGLGAAFWRLLETPTAYGEILSLVAAAFPDEDEERIDADLRALVGDCLRSQVVEIARSGSSRSI